MHERKYVFISLSLEKLRSSDATETGNVRNNDNAVTKSGKLEVKSCWIMKLRRSLTLLLFTSADLTHSAAQIAKATHETRGAEPRAMVYSVFNLWIVY